MAPHFEGCEFPQIDKYRWITVQALFDRLGRPSFVDEAVDQILGRIVHWKRSCELAEEPSTDFIRRLATHQAWRFVSEIE